MAYSAIHHTSHTAQISIKSNFKSAQAIKAAVRHNNRIGKEGSGVHIDKRREHLNKDLLDGQSQEDIYLNLINRISGKHYTNDNVPIYGEDVVRYEDGKVLRASKDRTNDRYDRVLAFEMEMMYPGDMVWSKFDDNGNVVPLPEDAKVDVADIAAAGTPVKDPTGAPILDKDGNPMIGKGYFKMPLNKAEFDEWCKATVEFAKERFGTENVVSAQLHMDEQTPHIHIMCTPLVQDKDGIERLNYYEMLGKEAIFGNIQDEYTNAVSYIGYHRGERNSQRINSITTKEYKVRLAKEMSKDMPTSLDAAKEEIRNLRVRNFDLSERMQEVKVGASKFQKARNQIDELEKRVKELEEKTQQQARTIQQQLERITIEENRKRNIEEGMKHHENQKAVEVFRGLEEQYLKSGYEYRRALGYSNEQLRYWEDRDHDGINDRREKVDLDHDGVGESY